MPKQKQNALPEIPEVLHDFRNFLYLVWKHLNLPDPTPVQYDIAEFLQTAPRRSIIQAFRGVGKSYVTSAYVVHKLLMNPDIKIMVISASKERADSFSTFTQRLIQELPMTQHLVATGDQRWSKIAFDVAPSQASHSPSVKSVGITGQLTGSRADIIIADDVEVPGNTQTNSMREKLAELVKEFDAVLKPEGRILYLGTPQCEDSLYVTLQDRGYVTRIWPARYPSEDKIRKSYGDRLAPFLLDKLEGDSELVGHSTDPQRFDDEDLLERELSYGRSGFALQFQLDTSLSDTERYPLKLQDLICMSVDQEKAPEKPIHGVGAAYELKEYPCLGMRGDRFYAPVSVSGDYLPYTGSVLAIDPSGRGSDETSYAVVKMLNGVLYVPDAGGVKGGYSEETLTSLVEIAKTHKVNMVIIESNFGDGMFTQLISPYFTKSYPVTLEEVRHSKQKELRIIDVLEPIMNQHRLVVDPKVIQRDYDSIQDYPQDVAVKYSMFYQMTRITKDKGALAHDDRLDALAMACQYWVEQMGIDADKEIAIRRSEELQKELDKFLTMSNVAPSGTRMVTWF